MEYVVVSLFPYFVLEIADGIVVGVAWTTTVESMEKRAVVLLESTL